MTTPDPYQPQQTGHEATGYPAPGSYPSPADPYATGGYPPTGIQSGYPGQPAYSGLPDPNLPAPYDTSGYRAAPPAYPQPAYGQPAYGVPIPGYPLAGPRNGMGTAALVCGIVAIPLDLTFYGGVILGILAIIFGGVGLGRAKRGEATNRGAAMAGLILGIVALALLVILIIAAVSTLGFTRFR